MLVQQAGQCIGRDWIPCECMRREPIPDGRGESLVLLLVYVDDILLFSSSDKEIDGVQRKLTEQFECKSLGEARYYLGMHIERDTERGWLKLHQGQYINTFAEKYSLQEEREVVTPLPSEFKLIKAAEGEGVESEDQRQFQSMVGSLLYAAVHTRPDISFAVGQLARVVQNPTEEQYGAAERVVRYLKSYPTVGVQYSASAQLRQKGVEVLKRRGSSSEKERCSFPILLMPHGLLSMRIHHQLVDTSAWWEVGL
ncbi:hypothetical protein CLOP_g19928 [Closterium sp. NIES-67]|nr:hypothetical protein CLOP_g19928 [Closterium sp. NIES-67]